MLYLEHFFLKCIIKNFFQNVNDPLINDNFSSIIRKYYGIFQLHNGKIKPLILLHFPPVWSSYKKFDTVAVLMLFDFFINKKIRIIINRCFELRSPNHYSGFYV